MWHNWRTLYKCYYGQEHKCLVSLVCISICAHNFHYKIGAWKAYLADISVGANTQHEYVYVCMYVCIWHVGASGCSNLANVEATNREGEDTSTSTNTTIISIPEMGSWLLVICTSKNYLLVITYYYIELVESKALKPHKHSILFMSSLAWSQYNRNVNICILLLSHCTFMFFSCHS